MGEMKKLRHLLIPITNRLEETALAERLDKTEDDQSVSLPNYGLWSQCRQWGVGGVSPSLHVCLVAVIAEVSARKHRSWAPGPWKPARQRSSEKDPLTGLSGGAGAAGNSHRWQLWSGLEHCTVGNLKTELSCLLGVSPHCGRSQSPWRLVQLPRNSMNGRTRSQSQGY